MVARTARIALAVLVVLFCAPAMSRPGGGSSFSGGSRSSSSSSFGGSHSSSHDSFGSSHSFGDDHSWNDHSSSSSSSSSTSYSGRGVPVPDLTEYSGPFSICSSLMGFLPAIFFVLMIVSVTNKRRRTEGWATTQPARLDTPQPPVRSPREKLLQLRTVGAPPFDPDFSLVLFEDFLYALYARVQQSRATGLDAVAPWVAENVRGTLAQTKPQSVGTIVIGAMRFVSVSPIQPAATLVQVAVDFEANYTEVGADGVERTLYVQDRWRLQRPVRAKSRPPARARAFDCPSCGAPLTEIRGDTCSHCGRQVTSGDFDWQVVAIQAMRREQRGPQLTGTTEEVGTEFPTIAAPGVLERFRELRTFDPTQRWDRFEARVRLTYDVMNDAWSSLEWEKARPFLSDNLFQMQTYWIDAYKSAGLRNVLEQMRVQRVEIANVLHDRWYDAITVRVFASGFDYTIEAATGEVVGGSKHAPRRYSEYWTFIRGTGVRRETTTEKKCPSCGAPLKINMAGTCEYCQAKVTSGEFDWVLSRIEQDETYGG